MSGARQSTLREIAERLERLQRQAEAAGLDRLVGIIRRIRVETEKARSRPPS